MRISMELFLLDNALMNVFTLGLAAALSGLRPRRFTALLLSAAGAVYALLALSAAPLFLQPVPKLLFGCVLATGLSFAGWRDYMRGLLALYIAAMLLGGLMLLVTLLLGGSVSGGVLIGTVPLRAALLASVLAICLPRLLRGVKKGAVQAGQTVTLRVTGERTVRCRALVDSGNALTDIASGLPVVLMTDCPCRGNGRDIPYETANGVGVLTAYRPRRAEAMYAGRRYRLDILVAQSPRAINGCGALIGLGAFPERAGKEQWHENSRETNEGMAPAPVSAAGRANAAVLYPYGREPAAAAAAGGRSALDRPAGTAG